MLLWGDTVAQKITHFYVYLILLGAILLYLPISLTSVPDHYSKTISEDYLNPATIGSAWNATIHGVVPASAWNQVINGTDHFFLLQNSGNTNTYLIMDSISGAPKIIQTQQYTFWDAIFVAASAFSDTGLTTVVLRSTYTVFGQVIVALLIQIGGIGFVVIAFLLWKIFRARERDHSAFSKALVLQAERGNSKLGGTTKTIIVAVIFIFCAEIVYAIFYALYFNFAPAFEQQVLASSSIAGNDLGTKASLITINSTSPIYVHNSPYAIWAGIFNSISAMNNAGFDILGSASLSAYRNDTNAVFLTIVASEFFIGGIGYPVIFEVYEHIRHKRNKLNTQKYRYSIFTKISLITSLTITIIGFILVVSLELTNPDGSVQILNQIANASPNQAINVVNNLQNNINGINRAVYGNNVVFNQVWNALFETLSTRSAGYSTISNNLYSDPTKIVLTILMFIGAAPSSTAGGIRTTTLALILVAVWSKLRGRKEVRMFKRTIPKETVTNAYVVTLLMIIWLGVSVFISAATIAGQVPDSKLTYIDILYEFSSAFGTVGLSTGVSNIITTIVPIPLILLVILMIIGQLGPSTTILAAVKKNPTGNTYKYPVEDIKIG
ncbi:TrkH family potassium uptake protein [[Mycoplasma] testudinis]|uniref:TrkH family potassium uptake protein n=1 Tax=[Mycoplasma] testudinis TaxID=33924 RepID=UPI00146FB665|nr:potassium transporter TrkG [[Mycoplasma] testudinis]